MLLSLTELVFNNFVDTVYQGLLVPGSSNLIIDDTICNSLIPADDIPGIRSLMIHPIQSICVTVCISSVEVCWFLLFIFTNTIYRNFNTTFFFSL